MHRICRHWAMLALRWRRIRLLEQETVAAFVHERRRKAVHAWMERARGNKMLIARVRKWSASMKRRSRMKLLQTALSEWIRKFNCQVNMRQHLQFTLRGMLHRSFTMWCDELRRLRRLRVRESVALPRLALLQSARFFSAWRMRLREQRLDTALQTSMAQGRLNRKHVAVYVSQWRAKVMQRRQRLMQDERAFLMRRKQSGKNCISLWRRAAERRVAFHTRAPAMQDRLDQQLMSNCWKEWQMLLCASHFHFAQRENDKIHAVRHWYISCQERKALCMRVARTSIQAAQFLPLSRVRLAWSAWIQARTRQKSAQQFYNSSLAHSALRHWRMRIQRRSVNTKVCMQQFMCEMLVCLHVNYLSVCACSHLYLARWRRFLRGARLSQVDDARVCMQAAVMLQWGHSGVLQLRRRCFSYALPSAFCIGNGIDDDTARLSILCCLFTLWRELRPIRRKQFMAEDWQRVHSIKRHIMAWKQIVQRRRQRAPVSSFSPTGIMDPTFMSAHMELPAVPTSDSMSVLATVAATVSRSMALQEEIAAELRAIPAIGDVTSVITPTEPSSEWYPSYPHAQLEEMADATFHRFLVTSAWDSWKNHFVSQVMEREQMEAADAFFQQRHIPIALDQWRNYVHVRKNRAASVDVADQAHACLLIRRFFYVWFDRHDAIQQERRQKLIRIREQQLERKLELQREQQQQQYQQRELEKIEAAAAKQRQEQDLRNRATLPLPSAGGGAFAALLTPRSDAVIAQALEQGERGKNNRSLRASSSSFRFDASAIAAASASPTDVGGLNMSPAAPSEVMTLQQVLASFPTPTSSLLQQSRSNRDDAATLINSVIAAHDQSLHRALNTSNVAFVAPPAHGGSIAPVSSLPHPPHPPPRSRSTPHPPLDLLSLAQLSPSSSLLMNDRSNSNGSSNDLSFHDAAAAIPTRTDSPLSAAELDSGMVLDDESELLAHGQILLADNAYACILLRRSFAIWTRRFEQACTGLSNYEE
jgi:hypothetical protein